MVGACSYGGLGMSQFMLLIRGGDEATRDYGPEQYQQLLQRYFDWADQLRSAGQYIAAEQLGPDGRLVHGPASVVDGPWTETKETIGGYYLITARDLNEASEIARHCPVLTHGGMVEVREVIPHG